ncbi:MAG: response regulator [Syntrophaceae bacterium]|jgi:two-component system chemotaxis response regulator CheY|nr:response regulator [Syntrophaceae bacterium]
MKVIIADDSRMIRNIIDKTISTIGCEAIHATNGREVLDLLGTRSEEVELILLDWNMPVLNGLDVLKSMQNNGQYQKIPVLMISTESEEDRIAQIMNAGAWGYLSKPFTPERLINTIRHTLEKKNAMKNT